MFQKLIYFLTIISLSTAFTTINSSSRGSFSTTFPSKKTVQKLQSKADEPNKEKLNQVGGATVTAALAFLLTAVPVGLGLGLGFTAAQVSDLTPPISVQIDARSVPVVGGLVSGRYSMVDDTDMGSPSIVVQAPKDLAAALKGLTGGHLELELNALGALKTELDVDIAAKFGEATVKVKGDIIPPLPFQNSANGGESIILGSGKKSNWYKVENVGDGQVSYYNEKTDETQSNAPQKI